MSRYYVVQYKQQQHRMSVQTVSVTAHNDVTINLFSATRTQRQAIEQIEHHITVGWLHISHLKTLIRSNNA